MSITVALIVIFFLAVIGIGIAGIFRTSTASQYLVAGRKTGISSTWGSLTATIVGGSSTMGMAGLSYARGLTGAWWLLVGVFGLIFLPLFVNRIKSRPVYTLPELLGSWYGMGVRKLSSILIAAAWLGIVAAQINASGQLLSIFFSGTSIKTWIILSGLVFTAYTVAGGQVSVIKTDLLQMILIIGGIVTAFIFALFKAGGIVGIREAVGPVFFSFPVSEAFPLKDLVFMILIVGTTYMIGPDMISRVFCSKNEKTAKKGIIITIITIIPLAFLISGIGIEARALFPGQQSEGAFPLLIRHVLPGFFGALTVVALLSAFLSSADTTLLTLSAIVSVDVIGIREEKSIKYRILTAVAGILCILVSLFSGGIIQSLLLGYTIFTGGLAVPLIFALAGRPIRPVAAFLSIIAGGTIALTGKLLHSDTLVLSALGISLLIALVDVAIRKRSAKGEFKVE